MSRRQMYILIGMVVAGILILIAVVLVINQIQYQQDLDSFRRLRQ